MATEVLDRPAAIPEVSPVSTRAQRNPILRLFTSVWFGILLLTLILVYSSIISAWPPARWTIEVTEMQAFRHWFFVTLVVLFMIALTTITIFRSRWTLMNAGSLLAHFGLLILSAGAIAYFGTKVEGDIMLQSPAILVRALAGERSAVIGRFRAETGANWSSDLPVLGQPLAINVVETLATGVQPVSGAVLSVRFGTQEKLVPVAANASWVPLGETAQVRLFNFPAQSAFYADESPVLYLRNPTANAEIVKALPRLPIHRERYLDGPEGVLDDARGRDVPSRRTKPELNVAGLKIPTGWFESWRMPIEVDSDGLPFAIQVTGYLPAVLGLNPVDLPGGKQMQVPVLEAPERRRLDIAPRSMSAIRVQLTGKGADANWSVSQWVLYSTYPDVEPRPVHVHVPGSQTAWEIVYSRARHELGATIAGRKFYVSYFPGERGIESFFSAIQVQEPNGTVQPAIVHTNQTLALGRWTLFQSGFDFETHWMYTVLGVGNRIGMWPMNIGWIIVALGCLFAFYVKPVLLRRARRSAAAE